MKTEENKVEKTEAEATTHESLDDLFNEWVNKLSDNESHSKEVTPPKSDNHPPVQNAKETQKKKKSSTPNSSIKAESMEVICDKIEIAANLTRSFREHSSLFSNFQYDVTRKYEKLFFLLNKATNFEGLLNELLKPEEYIHTQEKAGHHFKINYKIGNVVIKERYDSLSQSNNVPNISQTGLSFLDHLTPKHSINPASTEDRPSKIRRLT